MLKENTLFDIRDSPFKWLVGLRTLHLNYTFLESLAVTSFRGLHNLEYLSLSKNSLTSLPIGIFECLQNLQVLELQQNNLVEIPSKVLAPLKSLQELNIMFNCFSNLKFGEGFKNLTNLSILSVGATNLTSSGSEDDFMDAKDEVSSDVVLDNTTFQNLAKLPISYLNVWFWPFDNVTIGEGIFVPFMRLEQLSTAANWENAVPSIRSDLRILQIFIQPDDMKLYVASLNFFSKWKRSLEYIDLSYPFITGIYGPVFSVFSNLHTLKLSGVIYSMQFISDDAFFGLQNLQQLHLDHNQINKLPVEAFKAFENGTLTFLDLSYNSLTGFFPYDNSFSSLSSITHLNLSFNPMKSIGKWIHVLTNLYELKLNAITAYMYLDVSNWKVPLPSIRHLYINWPDFKYVLNAEFQFTVVNHVPNIETFSLTSSYVMSLAVVNHLQHLKYLNASGSFAVFKHFERSWGKVIILSQLQTLNLASNRIRYIDDMLLNKSAPNVIYLDLSNNLIQTFSSEFLHCLQNLQRLFLSGNRLSSLKNSENGLRHF